VKPTESANSIPHGRVRELTRKLAPVLDRPEESIPTHQAEYKWSGGGRVVSPNTNRRLNERENGRASHSPTERGARSRNRRNGGGGEAALLRSEIRLPDPLESVRYTLFLRKTEVYPGGERTRNKSPWRYAFYQYSKNVERNEKEEQIPSREGSIKR